MSYETELSETDILSEDEQLELDIENNDIEIDKLEIKIEKLLNDHVKNKDEYISEELEQLLIKEKNLNLRNRILTKKMNFEVNWDTDTVFPEIIDEFEKEQYEYHKESIRLDFKKEIDMLNEFYENIDDYSNNYICEYAKDLYFRWKHRNDQSSKLGFIPMSSQAHDSLRDYEIMGLTDSAISIIFKFYKQKYYSSQLSLLIHKFNQILADNEYPTIPREFNYFGEYVYGNKLNIYEYNSSVDPLTRNYVTGMSAPILSANKKTRRRMKTKYH